LFDVVNLDFLLSNVTSAECLFSSDFYYNRFIFVVVAPIALLFCSVVFVLIPRYFECLCFKHSTVQERSRSSMKFWKLFLYLLFLIYPSVSSTVLRHFVCKQIDDQSYLWEDLRVQCYTDRWTTVAFVAIALILLYPVGIPVFFFSLLKLNQKDFREPRIKAQLGFLYAGYRLEIWWWEILDTINKLVLTSLLAFAPQDAQLPLGMAIVTCYTFCILYFNPYLRAEDDLLALFSQVEIYLILLAGNVFYNLPIGGLSTEDDLIMSIALIILSVGFFCGFVFFIARIFYYAALEFLEKRKKKAARRLEREQAALAKLNAKMEAGPEFVEADEAPEEEQEEASQSGSKSGSDQEASQRSRASSKSHSNKSTASKSQQSKVGDLEVPEASPKFGVPAVTPAHVAVAEQEASEVSEQDLEQEENASREPSKSAASQHADDPTPSPGAAVADPAPAAAAQPAAAEQSNPSEVSRSGSKSGSRSASGSASGSSEDSEPSQNSGAEQE
jgi:hypothetical protein